jgi:predicted ATP-grasp superfamily ATP-dependent carboligase
MHTCSTVARKRAVLIEAFPGIGQVSSLAGKYIAAFFNLRYHSSFSAKGLPPVAVVRHHKPVPPASVYAGTLPDGTDLAVITSELPPPKEAVDSVAAEIMRWSHRINASVVISPHGMVVDDESDNHAVSIYGVASSQKGRKMLISAGIEVFEEGMVTGIPGLLLCHGISERKNVIALLVEVNEVDRDAGAAALMVHAIDKLCLHYDLDCGPICRAAIELGSDHIGVAKEIRKEKGRALMNSMYS